jgi:molecular chaperone GrpE
MDDKNLPKTEENDVVIEQDSDLDDSVVAEESQAETIKKLRLKLKEAEVKAVEYLTGWQRNQADFVNYKKREALERAEFLKFASEPLADDILNAMDSFDSAKNSPAWKNADENFRKGMEMIYSQLISALEKNNIKADDPKGEEFEPAKHLAVEMVDVTDEKQDGFIVDVLQKGYKIHDRVLRPAKVKVGRYNTK